jgi:hypothetical protein
LVSACLTNNVVSSVADRAGDARAEQVAAVMARFDVVVESSKVMTAGQAIADLNAALGW